MHKFIPVLVLLMTGCGGESFSAFGAQEADGGTQTVPDADAVTEVDSGAGGSGGATSTASGGSTVQETDGGTSTGGTSTGGAPAATGGATSTGGTTSTGGVTATGGTTACTPVTHSNGIGQTWQDCVPLYTYDKDQATKACEASGAVICSPSQNCGPLEITGYTADFGQIIGRWGYSSSFSGLVNGCYGNPPPHWT